MDLQLEKSKIGVVIPYYNDSEHISQVIDKMPFYIDKIYVIDDNSQEKLPIERIRQSKNYSKTICISLDKNLGVGGATKKGFELARKDGMEYIVKIDADDQMDTQYLPDLLLPIIENKADFTKGNRFKDFTALRSMPLSRRLGNLCLSFLTKIASGYWDVFDPNNGYLSIRSKSIDLLNFNNLSNRFFFETSLISELYFQKARIKDIPIPALYSNETSSLKPWKIPFEFIPKLCRLFIKRIVKTYFVFEFGITSIYILLGIPLFLFGIIFGLIKWNYYSKINELAPTGTIMLITLSIIIGFQLLLQAIHYDILNTPKAKGFLQQTLTKEVSP